MNHRALAAALLLLPSMLTASAGAEAELSTPETVVDAFHEALGGGDRQAVLDLLTEDVLIFESGGAELSRDEYAHHHLGSDMEFSAATESKVVDRRRGGDEETSWVLTRTETSGTFRDREISARGTETMILSRGESGWKIVHIHWSSR